MNYLNPSDFYRAIYSTLWRMNERHDLRPHLSALSGDNDDWRPEAA